MLIREAPSIYGWNMSDKPIDLVVFAPHPDDAELAAGGLILKLRKQGRRCAIVDLTRGELGTKGNPELRAQEAQAASRLLQLDQRIGLDLGDGQLLDSSENRKEIVEILRALRPRLIIAPWQGDEHPDHRAAYQLIHAAFFLSRLPKYETQQPFHAVGQFWTYGIHHEAPHSFIVDISQEFPEKLLVLQCYQSQFIHPQLPEGYQSIGVSNYLEHFENRGRYWGSKIGTTFGEAFSSVTPLRIEDPLMTGPSL